MKLDLKGFQRISKQGSLTKLRHPQGHEITVNHSILSPKMRGEIEALPQISKDKSPDSSKLPHFDNGGDVSDTSSSVNVNQYSPSSKSGSGMSGLSSMMAQGGLQKPTQSATPEQSAEIAKQNEANTSITDVYGNPIDDREVASKTDGGKVQKFAEGSDEPVKVEGKDVDVPVSRTEAKYGAEEDAVNKSLDVDPNIQLEDQANGVQSPVSSTSEEDSKPDPAQSMLDAHSDAMEAHNMAMKLFAGAQQPQSNQSQAPSGQAQPNQPPQPENPSQQQSGQPQAAAQDLSQQPSASGQQPAAPVDTSYQSNVEKAAAGVQDLKSYVDKQEAANTTLGQKVMDGTIDPKRLYKNMSTAGRITSTIGLILGGLGAGASGGRNLAAEAMQKAIENDVDAQKADQSKNMNLYKMNLEATKDATEAKSLTINQLMSTAQAQLAKRASDTQNQMGQLEAQKAIQDIQAKKMENSQNAYKFKIIQDLNNGPQANNVPPGQVDLDKFNKYKLAGIMPKEDSEAATKEANAYQEKIQLQKDMDDSANHLSKQIGAGAFTPSDRQSAINAFAGRIAKLGEGRFNLDESKLQAQALLPQPGDLPSTDKNKAQRRAAFFDSIAQTPTLDRYKLVNHAPPAAPIKKMNGVSYQLGADGNYHKVGK
jgi:hypothetical protein